MNDSCPPPVSRDLSAIVRTTVKLWLEAQVRTPRRSLSSPCSGGAAGGHRRFTVVGLVLGESAAEGRIAEQPRGGDRQEAAVTIRDCGAEQPHPA